MTYLFENYSLDTSRRELRRGGKLIAVGPLVFDLLQFLIRNRDRVVSKDDLIAEVWSGRIVSESTLTSRINAVRSAIGDSGAQQRLIRTVARKGHRFIGDVEEDAHRRPEASIASAKNPATPMPSATQTVMFCRTSDGVNIAAATAGSGLALVRTAYLATHIEYDWQYPFFGPILQNLTKYRRVVRYDGRGTGLSDRNVPEISFTTFLNDLDVVIDSLKLERFAMLGMSGGAATAVAYAVRHPQRISKLVLFGGYMFGRNKRGSPQSAEEAKAFYTMLRSGWGNSNSPFWRAFNSFFLPSGSPEQISSLMDYHRAAAAAEDSIKLRMALDDIDVLALASKVRVPTIIFHCLRDNLVPFEQGRMLAASIPNAKFVALDSENHILLPQEPAWAKFVAEMEAFLADGA